MNDEDMIYWPYAQDPEEMMEAKAEEIESLKEKLTEARIIIRELCALYHHPLPEATLERLDAS
jgi:hypothetical protein